MSRQSNKDKSASRHQAREDARASGALQDRPATTPSSRARNEPSNPDSKLVGNKSVDQQNLRVSLQNIRDTVDTSKKSK